MWWLPLVLSRTKPFFSSTFAIFGGVSAATLGMSLYR